MHIFHTRLQIRVPTRGAQASRPDRYPPRHFNILLAAERWVKISEEYTGRHYIYTRAGIQYSRYDDEQTRVVVTVLWSQAGSPPLLTHMPAIQGDEVIILTFLSHENDREDHASAFCLELVFQAF